MIKIVNIYQDKEGYFFWAYLDAVNEEIPTQNDSFKDSKDEYLLSLVDEEKDGFIKVYIKDTELNKIKEEASR